MKKNPDLKKRCDVLDLYGSFSVLTVKINLPAHKSAVTWSKKRKKKKQGESQRMQHIYCRMDIYANLIGAEASVMRARKSPFRVDVVSECFPAAPRC